MNGDSSRTDVEKALTAPKPRAQFLILGDCSIDQYLALNPETGQTFSGATQPGYKMVEVPGGAWLVRRALESALGDSRASFELGGIPPWTSSEAMPVARTSLAFLDLFPTNGAGGGRTYRLASRPRFRDAAEGFRPPTLQPPIPKLPAVAIIEHMSLRHSLSAMSVQLKSAKVQPYVVIHKLSSYVDNSRTLQGELDLGKHLTVVILDADTLRFTGFRVSKGLSWERTACTAVDALNASKALSKVVGAAMIVIRLGHAGFLYRYRLSRNQQWKTELLYDASMIEGEWGDSSSSGGMFGYLSNVAARVAIVLADQLPKIRSRDPQICQQWVAPLESALCLARTENICAFVNGLGKDFDVLKEFEAAGGVPWFRTAQDSTAAALSSSPVPHEDGWDLATQPFSYSGASSGEILAVATNLVISGLKPKGSQPALPRGVPHAQVSSLLAVGRQQLEVLRSARAVIDGYLTGREERPLSLAVFGQPGSGKSFAVRQLARATSSSTVMVETNLSQLGSPVDLNPVFQRARDIAVVGQIPIIFLDEFDSELDKVRLGWLRYFLSPMEDGMFNSSNGPSRLGRSILVFAGGTAQSYAEFLAPLDGVPAEPSLKFPDFVSRLDGYLDLVGIGGGNGGSGGGSDEEVLNLLRRAILLRSMLERDQRGILDSHTGDIRIDRRLAQVLLTVSLNHGARSLESIIRRSHPDDRSRLTLSSLPPSDSLRAHVDPNDLEDAVLSSSRES